MFRYEVRSLDSVPWPAGLGKGEYSRLRDAMKQLLKAECDNPAAHERAFATSEHYRKIADRWLSKTAWSPTVVEVVSGATSFAHGVGVLGQSIEEDHWRNSAKSYCDARGIAYGACWNGGPFVAADYLQSPITISDNGNSFDDGRHRITYLRLRERDGAGPSEILVKVAL